MKNGLVVVLDLGVIGLRPVAVEDHDDTATDRHTLLVDLGKAENMTLQNFDVPVFCRREPRAYFVP